jgi:hypothetical protein
LTLTLIIYFLLRILIWRISRIFLTIYFKQTLLWVFLALRYRIIRFCNNLIIIVFLNYFYSVIRLWPTSLAGRRTDLLIKLILIFALDWSLSLFSEIFCVVDVLKNFLFYQIMWGWNRRFLRRNLALFRFFLIPIFFTFRLRI